LDSYIQEVPKRQEEDRQESMRTKLKEFSKKKEKLLMDRFKYNQSLADSVQVLKPLKSLKPLKN
jgi:hypothetical protein